MKGYEIFKGIANRKIKDGTRFKMLKDDNIYTYRNNNFVCKYGGMNVISILNDEFEIIEDKEDINIQGIEELEDIVALSEEGYMTRGTFIGITDKINELVQAVKQLDKTKEDK